MQRAVFEDMMAAGAFGRSHIVYFYMIHYAYDTL